jgi:predicted naringenin-chalcone synthase
MGHSYIVKSSIHLPKEHQSNEIMNALYKKEALKKLARRFSASTGIENRHIAIELDKFPCKHVLPGESPVEWLTLLYKSLLREKQANFISLSYNISSHQNFIPSISSQLCSELGSTRLRTPPEEYLFIGCASAIFSLNAAANHCSNYPEDIAFVAAYEQSSWLYNPETKRDCADFIPSLRGHSLFGDGAAGLLVCGEKAASDFDNKVLIIDAQLSFSPGNCIGMKEGRFLVGDKVGAVMPDMVARKVILPLLRRHNLTVSDVEEWSIHQGSHRILDEFKRQEILGLTDEQLQKSHRSLSKIGNISSPSCLFVFDEWLKTKNTPSGSYGMIVGFGAGYYMGAILYKKV